MACRNITQARDLKLRQWTRSVLTRNRGGRRPLRSGLVFLLGSEPG